MQREPRNNGNLLVPILFLLVTLFFFYDLFTKRKKENKYFDQLDLDLSGIIRYYDEKNGFNGFAVIGLDILHSNKPELAPLDQPKTYYCIIKNGKAELYSGCPGCEVGDTVKVDSKRRLIKVLRQNGETDSASIAVYDNELFWRYVKEKYHRLD